MERTDRNGDVFREIGTLAEASLRGELSDAEAARLERLVVDNAEARRIYVRYMHESQSLHTWSAQVLKEESAGPATVRPTARKSRPGSSTTRIFRVLQRSNRSKAPNPVILPATVAAALLIGLIGALIFSSSGTPTPRTARELPSPQAPRPVLASETADPPVPATERPGRMTDLPRAEALPTGEKGRTPRFPERPVAPDGRRIEERMRAAVERSRIKRGLPPRKDASPSRITSVAAGREIARLEEVSGGVEVVRGSRRERAVEGQILSPGMGVETSAAGGRARIVYPDATRLILTPGTVLSELAEKKGKQIVLQAGRLEASVTRQPAGRPLRLRTPQAEATVLGTTLELSVEMNATLLKVSEGRVRLSHPSQRGSVEVTTGNQAVATAGGRMWSGPYPLKEIVVLTDLARIVGPGWRRVQDPQAIGGKALDAPHVMELEEGEQIYREGKAYAEFIFPADAGVTYNVWVRGRCFATERPTRRDAVTVEPFGAAYVNMSSPLLVPGRTGTLFNGFSHAKEYGWLAGNADPSRPSGIPRDTVPTSLRFDRSGLQRIRVYVTESPVRIDALWLSASRTTRPTPDQKGPR